MSFVSCFDKMALAVLSITTACGICGSALAQTKPVTTTALSVTSSGSPVTTVAPGTVVTLTATVKAGSTPLTTGQVNFCDAGATYCTDIHLLGMAQLTKAGTAVLRFRPGIGDRSYKAMFLGTSHYAGSSSTASALAVPGTFPTTTTIQQTGFIGNYTLTATVSAVVDSASTPPPTGTISFVDTTTSNSVLATAQAGEGTPSVVWTQMNAPSGTFEPVALGTGDFNGDGIPDLAVAQGNSGALGLGILLGNGDGTFAAAASPTVGPYPDVIMAADFNGDGIADLAVASVDASNITILLGKGNGTFSQSAPVITLSSIPQSIAVADFNEDGIPDLAVTDGAVVTVFLGKGDGSFTKVSASPPTGSGALGIATADFNGDGIPDLAVTNGVSNGTVTILLGNGDGTFAEAKGSPFETGSGPDGVVTADFNGDGISDLATPNQDVNGSAAVLLTQPTETVTASVGSISPLGPGPHQVEASYPGDSNYAASTSGTTSLTVQVATPSVSLAPGTYTTVQTVTITDATPGSTIYYSLYGTTSTNGLVQYAGPFFLSFGGYESLQVYATETGYQPSSYTYATYTLNYPQAPAPVISLSSGSYPGPQSTTISEPVSGSTIYYTSNGTFPFVGSTQYASAIAIPSSETIVATAIAPGYSLSQPATAQYFIDSATSSFIYTVAGDGTAGYSGDGGPAAVAEINDAGSTVEDKAGNLYIADVNNNVVREVAAGTGIITTIAGNGTPGYSGDGGPATKAQLLYPAGLALDGAGNLFIADFGNNAIRKVSAADDTLSTYVSGINNVSEIAVDGSGNLFVPHGNSVLRVAAGSKAVTTYAGTGQYGYTGDGGPATSATLDLPSAVATDSANNLYIADTYNQVIRKVSAANQTISTIAGDGFGAGRYQGGYSGDGGPATKAELNGPNGVAVDRLGNVFISDQNNARVREVTASSGTISTIAGNGVLCADLSGDGAAAISSGLCGVGNISVDLSGNLYLNELYSNRIQEVTAPALPPTTAAAAPRFSIAGGTYDSPQSVSIMDTTPGAAIYVTLDGSAPTTTSHGYNGPVDISGNLTINAVAVAPGYLPSAPVSAAYTITSPPTATITTLAGTGTFGFTQAGGPALSVSVGYPAGIARDSAGNIYFSDPDNYVVWMLSAQSGDLSVIAGNGSYGYGGDGGPATGAMLNDPQGVAVDGKGNLFIADAGNEIVREVAADTGTISTYAGEYDRGGFGDGDGGPATQAYLSVPQGLAFDTAGNLYIAEAGSDRVRMVNAETGIINTVAGTGVAGSTGDGGPATEATLDGPFALAIDSTGNFYIGTNSDGRVRKVNAATGIITTVAGDGDPYGTSGDGGPATSAEVDAEGLAVDSAGNLYLSNFPGSIRQIAVGTGVITTVAGNGYYGYTGDGGSATVAEISNPTGIATDPAGNLYIADSSNYRVRQVTFSGPAVTPVFSPAAGNYGGTQNVTIYDGTPGATIYYTTDGTMPSSKSSVYSTPIAVASSQTLKAIAILNGRTQSDLATATYTITAATPIISLAPGAYVGAQSVTISDASPGATIYYTTDGVTVPSASSAVYTGPIAVTASETIMAIAVASGFPNSAVVSAAYIIRYQPVLNWTVPAEIIYGTELGTTQLDAGASVAGTFAYSPKAGTKLPAGVHTLSVTFTPSNAAIYTTATKSVEITVNKAMLTVTAKKAAKIYGAEVPRLLDTITGFVFGETAEQAVSGKPELTTKATAKSKIGIYPITASTGTLKSQNYEFRFVDADLTITKAELTFAAKNVSVESGKPLPKLTYSIEGFVNGDTAKVLSGKPIESTTAKQSSPPGVYKITIKAGTLKTANYSFEFKDAKLTITKP